MRNFRSVGFKGCCLALVLVLAGIMPAAYADSTSGNESVALSCGAAPPGHPVKGRRDYRLMSTNVKDRRDLRYHEYFHIDPARKAISRGQLDWDVMNNLHFVLHKVPNDERALGLLVQWDKAGGRDKRYASPACYMVWAREFVPDDPKVLMYGGYYFYQHKDLDRARQWWEEALVLDAKNADVHYNLGLLLFEQGLYAEARAHAKTAYDAGYPLPGLRNKLQAAGQWHDALQTAH